MNPEINGNDLALFSLFHHDISKNTNGYSYLNSAHFNALKETPTCDDESITNTIIEIVKEGTSGCLEGEVGLTLTGGFDSRVILATLLSIGIKPICFTYGNPRNKDISISKKICKTYGLKHVNTVSEKPTATSYLKAVKETILIDKGDAHLHRAHRTLAINEFTKQQKIKVLFTGHFGGEQIRGLSYNNYFSSSIFEEYNERQSQIEKLVEEGLKKYFLKEGSYSLPVVIEKVKNLKWMQRDKQNNKLYFLYDLVGMNHHMQDIRIYSKYVDKVIPVYLDDRFIDTLMRSPHHFSRKKSNKLASLSHPKLYCEIIKILYPELLKIELSNGYKPSDYEKGIFHYVKKRIFKKYILKSYNPPSFSYGQWYIDFVTKNSNLVQNEIWEYFDQKAYFHALKENQHASNEGYWHKFSNPIFFNLKKLSK